MTEETTMTRPVDGTTRVVVERTVRNNLSKEVKESTGENEVIEIQKFVTTPSVVSVGGKFTKNLGNYESAQISVMVSRPCYKEEEEACYEYCQQFVETRLSEEIEKFED